MNYESAVPFRSSFDLKLVGKILGSTVGGSLTERGDRDRAEGGAGGALAPPLFCKNKNKLNKK